MPVSHPPPSDLRDLIRRVEHGDSHAADELLPLVYDQLHALAQRLIGPNAQRNQTLQATGLIHEAYLRLAGSDLSFADAQHFVRVAARAMRQALVDHARKRGAVKRGGGQANITFDEQLFEVADRSETLLAIDEALDLLHDTDPQLAQIVELRFFAGLSHQQTAAALDASTRSVERGWRLARAFLLRALSG